MGANLSEEEKQHVEYYHQSMVYLLAKAMKLSTLPVDHTTYVMIAKTADALQGMKTSPLLLPFAAKWHETCKQAAQAPTVLVALECMHSHRQVVLPTGAQVQDFISIVASCPKNTHSELLADFKSAIGWAALVRNIHEQKMSE